MSSNLFKSTIFATTALGLGVGLAAPAFAQNTESGEGASDIVVTARRVEERLQDVPISITVFNQQQLSNRNVVNAADLATYTPSLSADTRFGSESSAFAIRGFSQELRTTPSVGVYFADVVSPRAGNSTFQAGEGAGPGSFFDLQNVQVLKGPQGTLFGRNTTGGAILLVPQRPTDEFGGYLEVSGGDYDMSRVQAVLNVPFSNNARLRLGMDREYRDGYLDNVSGVGASQMSDINYEAYRVSFVANLTPSLENYTVVSYSHSLTTGTVSKLADCNLTQQLGFLCLFQQLGEAAAGHNDFYDVASYALEPHTMINQWQAINTTTWDISDTLTLKNIVSYAELSTELNTPVFGLNFTNPISGLPFYFTGSQQIPGVLDVDQSTFTDELQFQGRSRNNLFTWQAGLYHEESGPLSTTGSEAVNRLECDLTTIGADPNTFRCNDPSRIDPSNLVNGAVTINHNTVNYVDQAIYAQGSYNITDRVKFTAGVRYTWDRVSSHTQLFAYQFPGDLTSNLYSYSALVCADPAADADCRSSITEQSESPTWLLDVDYTPTDDLLLYAKYARGYRQGTVIPDGVSVISGVSGLNHVGPEQVDAYELGFKQTFHGQHPGILNASLFYNSFSDQQIQLGVIPATGAPTTILLNAGASTIYGLELEGAVELFKDFNLHAAYTYLHTNLDELTLPNIQLCNGTTIQVDCVTAPTSLPGEPLTYSPMHKAEVTASYRLPLPDSIGDVTAALTYVFVDDIQIISPTRTPYGVMPSYELTNFNLNWANVFGAPVDASVFVTNVLDEKYYTYTAGLYESAGVETLNVGEPRMIGALLRYRFGG